MAAPASGLIPRPKIVLPNTVLATAVPDVVEAVAADIRIPDIGASINAGNPPASSPDIIRSLSPEFAIIPEIVPVPRSKMATPLILPKPSRVYWFKCLILPIARAPTIPPTGRASSGSIFISAKGLNDNMAIVTMGPNIDAKKLGFSSLEAVTSLPSILTPFFTKVLAIKNVTINPNIAGIIPAPIIVVGHQMYLPPPLY